MDYNIEDTLFDLYDIKKEAYYVKRQNDLLFVQKLSQYGVWVYGPTGCGKSNLILRNLNVKQSEFIQVNLAFCIGQNVEDYFNEILYEVASKTEGIKATVNPQNFKDCVKSLIDLLNKYYKNKELIIFIEEIPISLDQNQREFSDKLFSLLITKSLAIGLEKIKFILSSIHNPKKNIPPFQQKIHQQLSFIEFDYWIEEDINKLICLIETSLELIVSSSIKDELIKKAKGSPRFIKKFYRTVIGLNKLDDDNLMMVINETDRELNFYDV